MKLRNIICSIVIVYTLHQWFWLVNVNSGSCMCAKTHKALRQIHILPERKMLWVIIIRPHRSSTCIDAVYCYRRNSVVSVVTIVSLAKTAEPIEIPFGLWTWVGPNPMHSMEIQIPSADGQFWGEGVAHCKLLGQCVVRCAKTAEPIEMPFGM